MAAPHLTIMRQSFRDAIENYPPLKGFRRKFWFEEAAAMKARQGFADWQPAIADFPAFLAMTTNVQTSWYTNQEQMIDLTIGVILWTPHCDLRPVEGYWQLIHRAVWQSKAGTGQQPYVLDACEPLIEISSPTSVEISDEAGQATGIRTELSVGLKRKWNPLIETAAVEF